MDSVEIASLFHTSSNKTLHRRKVTIQLEYYSLNAAPCCRWGCHAPLPRQRFRSYAIGQRLPSCPTPMRPHDVVELALFR